MVWSECRDFVFCKQNTAYEMRISDWSSDVCSSDLVDQHKLDGVTFYRTVKVQDRFGFVQFGVNGDPRLSLAPIRHEPTSETGVHHVSGTLSIARLEPGSARGEFTIMVDRKSTRLNSSH